MLGFIELSWLIPIVRYIGMRRKRLRARSHVHCLVKLLLPDLECWQAVLQAVTTLVKLMARSGLTPRGSLRQLMTQSAPNCCRPSV